MFDWLVHSKTRLRMMKLFFKDSSTALYGLEIAKTLKASPGTIHRELNALLKQGIITKKKDKGLVLYYLNQKHPYFRELKKSVSPKKKTKRVLFIGDIHLNAGTEASILEDLYIFCDYAEENATELVLLGDIVEMLTGDVFQTYLIHKPLFDKLIQLSHDVKITYVVGNHDCFLESLCHEGVAGQFFGSSIKFAKEYIDTKLGIFAKHGHFCDDFSVLRSKKVKKHVQCNSSEIQKKIKKAKIPDDFSPHLTQLSEICKYADKALDYSQYVKQKKLDSTPMLVDAAKELIHQKDYSYVVFGHSHKSALKDLGHGLYLNPGSWKSEKKHNFVEIDNEGGALVSIKELI